VYVGLDAGGTKTRLRAEDEKGAVLAEAVAGPANLASTPEGVWKASLAELSVQCPKADYVAGCFAGLMTREDEGRASVALSKLFGEAKVAALPDYGAAVASAPAGTSVVVTAGTGSVVANMVEGRIHKSSGGGPLLGDAGSGYDIGRWGLRKLLLGVQAPDAGEETWAKIEEVFGSRDPAHVVATIYKMPAPAASIARITPRIVADAEAGYPYATAAVSGSLAWLAGDAAAHLEQTLPTAREWNVGLTGGVWSAGSFPKHSFDEAMQIYAARALGDPAYYSSHVLDLDPVNGAVALARKLAGSA